MRRYIAGVTLPSSGGIQLLTGTKYMISKQVTRCSFPDDGRFEAFYIQQLIHLYERVKIEDAAKQLGLGITALKKRCRQVGIQRWPHRQVSEQM